MVKVNAADVDVQRHREVRHPDRRRSGDLARVHPGRGEHLVTAMAHDGTPSGPAGPVVRRERGGFDRFDPPGSRPAMQKYDDADFVDRLLADPPDSLSLRPRRTTSGPTRSRCPRWARGEGRLRFATHQLVPPSCASSTSPATTASTPSWSRCSATRPGCRGSAADDDLGQPGDPPAPDPVRRDHARQLRQRPASLITHLLAAQHDGAVPGSIDELTDVDQVLRAESTRAGS